MFDLRNYQKPISPKIFRYLERYEDKHPLVAAPTGSGKTVILSDIISKAIEKWPDIKILVISHVQEILEQDHSSISFHLNCDIGLFSAGLDRREVKQITVAGIQSIFRNPQTWKEYGLIIIDECHLIPPGDNTMYRRFFAGLEKPRYIGLTATPFRLGSGYIYGEEDSIFDDLVYDLTSLEKFNKLIEDGYLCDLKVLPTSTKLDADDIRIVGGDFDKKMLSKKFDVTAITKSCIKEMVQKGAEYKKWLIFAIDIEHAENIAEELAIQGITAMVIHSKIDFDREAVLKAHREGVFQALVNVNILTTGYDDPSIDLIGILRPTQSPVIHVQTIGRGLRIAEGKDHCLVLDFAGNTQRLGPINDIKIRKRRKGKKGGEPITKECPDCEAIHHPAVKVCQFCGHKFQFKTKLQESAGDREVIAKKKHNGWYKVDDVTYKLHTKKNRPNMVKVTYQCGLRFFSEIKCFEHKGYAGHNALHWAKYRGLEHISTSKEVVDKSSQLKKPSRIKVDTSGRYDAITDYSF